jgi:hypothetical protein
VWASLSAASGSSSVVSNYGAMDWSSTVSKGLVVIYVVFKGLCASWVVHLLFSGDLFCMWFLPK